MVLIEYLIFVCNKCTRDMSGIKVFVHALFIRFKINILTYVVFRFTYKAVINENIIQVY